MISQTADGMAGTGSDLGEREAVRKLLGRNPERYLRTYDRMKANGRLRMLGWCWSGMVFGATFAFYRRLYPALLAVEGTLSLMAGAGIGLAVSQGVALNHAAGAVATMHWLLGAAFYALFGRFLVVRACLVRWQRRPDSAEHLGAWSGPLLRFRLMLVLVFVGSLVLGIVLGLMATERPVGQSATAGMLEKLRRQSAEWQPSTCRW